MGAEVKKTGIFTIPGLCRIKTSMEPATKAGKQEIFGKLCIVKATPAMKIVKALLQSMGGLADQRTVCFDRLRMMAMQSTMENNGFIQSPQALQKYMRDVFVHSKQ